jgi:hypothetical protein
MTKHKELIAAMCAHRWVYGPNTPCADRERDSIDTALAALPFEEARTLWAQYAPPFTPYRRPVTKG